MSMSQTAGLSTLSTGAIIGIIFAIFLGLTLMVAFILGCVLWRLRCKGRRVDAQERAEKVEADRLKKLEEAEEKKAMAQQPPSHELPLLPPQAFVQGQQRYSQQCYSQQQQQQQQFMVAVPVMPEPRPTDQHALPQLTISQMYGYKTVA
ncbi:hypothetical protein EV175_000563 [Coemansia sp. RSA 1933]|nr:hypothetical protein EV175_000563 [Coemansia sp. RSA 1933]